MNDFVKLKNIFNDQYFMADITKLNVILKRNNISEVKFDFSNFDKLPIEYQKIIIVIHTFTNSDNLIY